MQRLYKSASEVNEMSLKFPSLNHSPTGAIIDQQFLTFFCEYSVR